MTRPWFTKLERADRLPADPHGEKLRCLACDKKLRCVYLRDKRYLRYCNLQCLDLDQSRIKAEFSRWIEGKTFEDELPHMRKMIRKGVM